MLPELGFIALLIALTCSVLLVVIPHIGIMRRRPDLIRLAWHFSYLFAIFTALSIALLAYAFATDDFSVQYVAAHSNSHLPLLFKLAATWGGHEGSMLFWLFSLSLWMCAFALFSRKIDPLIVARTLSLLGLICAGLAIFILFFSDPFLRLFPPPPEGRDLNPMLQDIGLIFHPPLLYFGYVGFAVNFALTLSALVSGHLDAAIARWMRPWVLTAWLFLTLGIVLGAWWAYYELGWGGWWFWDPAENASLMPWLLGLALLHSLSVTQQRGIFSYWTILFSLFSFAFSLLGTFIIRSGVLTSVHAFAMDNQRGAALLILFFLLSVGALSVFALKAKAPPSAVRFSLFSRESAMLAANIIFSVATASVFLGTFYPLLFSTMGWGSISVGPPYFNTVFLPLFIVLLVIMLLVPATGWKHIRRPVLLKYALLALPALILAYLLIEFTLRQEGSLHFNVLAWCLLSLAFWLLLSGCYALRYRLSLRGCAMLLAHGGVAVTMIGAVMSSYFGSEIGVRLAPQQSRQLGGYEFRYLGFSNELGPNYTSEKAHFDIIKNGKKITALYPERRYYDARAMTMSEVGLASGWLGDLYIVMGDKLGNGEFTFRLHYKPFVRWLWLGGILMALGALCGALGLRKQGDV